jgi:hypothetical protein
MHKRWAWMAAALLTILTLPVMAVEVGDEPAISVRETEVRRTASFLGPILEIAEYGQSVTVLQLGAGWVRVRVEDTGTEGWVHASAVAEKQALRLEQSGDIGRGVTSQEIALAGRGFNEQVEARYKSEADLADEFALVSRMEENERPIAELGEFFAAANLGFGEGAAE